METEFEKELQPILEYIEEKLKHRVPNTDELDKGMVAALMKSYHEEQLNNINTRELRWIEKDALAGPKLIEFMNEQPETSPLYGISSKLLRKLIIAGIEIGLNLNEDGTNSNTTVD